MCGVDKKRFPSQQVHGDRVAGKGVEDEKVEILRLAQRGLAFQGKPPVAEYDFNGGPRVPQIGEVGVAASRLLVDIGINLVKAENVTALGERCKCGDAHSDQADPHGVHRPAGDDGVGAGLWAIVASGKVSPGRILKLKAVHSFSMTQGKIAFRRTCHYGENAVEISGARLDVVKLGFLGDGEAGGEQRKRGASGGANPERSRGQGGATAFHLEANERGKQERSCGTEDTPPWEMSGRTPDWREDRGREQDEPRKYGESQGKTTGVPPGGRIAHRET